MSENKSMKIPDAAAEAVAQIVADSLGYGWVNDEHRDIARTIIDAVAAPLKADAYEEVSEAYVEGALSAEQANVMWQKNPYKQ